MKTRQALLILAAATVTASTVYAEKIQLSQAPASVQQAIRSRAGRHQIEDIDRDVRSGQVTYEASWKGAGGAQQELLVSESGRILRDVVGASTGLSGQNLTLANKTGIALTETPRLVQAAIHNQIPSAPIDGVQKGIWNGQTIYEVTYHDNGQLKTYQVTETGQSVVNRASVSSWQPHYSNLADKSVPLSGSGKLAFDAAPKSVRTTVTHMANGAPIEDFERGQWNGRTVYEAAFKRNGQNVELQIFEDGTIINRAPFEDNPASASQPAVGALGVRYAGLADSNVSLSGGSKMAYSAAPRLVRNTVQRVTEGAPVEDFERGTWNGRTVYEAAFKRNGQNVELQVLDDGSILTKQLPTAYGAPPAGVVGSRQQ